MTELTPDITAVTVVRHDVVHLTSADGVTGEVDILGRMHGPVFAQARTLSEFKEFVLDSETGTIV